MSQTFGLNPYLVAIEIKLKGINKVINMSEMFRDCSTLIYLLNIHKIDTSKVTNMSMMFNNCRLVKKIPDISIWNASNVTNMNRMFELCKSL